MSLRFLNLYEDAITNAKDIAQDLLKEADTILNDFEMHLDSAPFWCLDLDEAVLCHLEETANFHDLTNSIISAYFYCAIDAIMQNPFFEEHGISFTYDANCHASEIAICVDKETSRETQTYSEGALTDMIRELIINNVLDDFMPFAEEHYDGTGIKFEREWLKEDLSELDLSSCLDKLEEYSECVRKGTLSDSVKIDLLEAIIESPTPTM